MKLVPTTKEERNLKQVDFFLLWAGAAISIMEIFSGAILAPLGLLMGTVAIIVGHLIGNTPFALAGLPGQEKGVTSMVSVRFSFGIRGSHIFAFLNIMQLIGWMAVMEIVAADAMDAMMIEIFSYSNPHLWIVIIGVLTTLWALSGEKVWKIFNRISVTFLLILTVFVFYKVFFVSSISFHPKGYLPFAIALDLVIAMPISWIPLVSDYSRFARKGSFWGTWIGYFIVSSWMYFIGLISALATGEALPTKAMFLLGLGMPAMVIVALSTITSDYLDVYSSAASWLNIRPKSSDKLPMVISGALGIAVALLFPIEQYQSFLLWIGSVFCPLFAIVITDYFMKRKDHDLKEVLKEKGGKYWYKHGFNLKAIFAWVVGLSVYWIANYYQIGASIPSMGCAACLYYLFERK